MTKNQIGLLLLSILLIPFFMLASGYAADPAPERTERSHLILTADKQFDLAQHYFTNHEYIWSISEFKRFVYFFPTDDRIVEAYYTIGMAYIALESFNEALKNFRIITDTFQQSAYALKATFMIASCYQKKNDMHRAITTLKNIIAANDHPDIIDQAYHEIGWIFLEFPWVDGAIEQATFYFLKISPKGKQKYKIDPLVKELGHLLTRSDEYTYKHPKLAGILSIIPGAGHLYCGRYQDALIAFLLNTGLILASYEAFYKKQPALGSMIGFAGTGFYAGNIYGAVSSAHKINRNQAKKAIDRLKKTHNIAVSIGAFDSNPCICFNVTF